MNINQIRKNASRLSLGLSSELIVNAILKEFRKLQLPKDINIIDIGCGQGTLLGQIKAAGYTKLTGCDYSNFEKPDDFIFFQHDCNKSFPDNMASFDLVLCSEVIEHIENPWSFIRELIRITKNGGNIILSTPNPESLLSIITLIFKGYFNAFGPSDYPAHISPVSEYQICNMVEATGESISEVVFMNNGRIPGSANLWSQYIPFLEGKRFSDNFIVLIHKN